MIVRNIVGKIIDASKMEIETNISNNISDIQSDNIKNMNTLEMKLYSITLIQNSSSDYPKTELLDWKILKTPEKSTHASQLTKHPTPLTQEGETILQLHKWRDTIICAYLKSLSTKKCCPTYKSL